MKVMIDRSWVLLVSAGLLSLLALGLAVFAPIGPHGTRGLVLIVAAAIVTWILWGQVATTRIRRADRESADASLRLILGGALPQQNRRTHIR